MDQILADPMKILDHKGEMSEFLWRNAVEFLAAPASTNPVWGCMMVLFWVLTRNTMNF